jgi:PilZ domain
MRKVDENRRGASDHRVEWQDLDWVRNRRKYTRRGVQLEARVRTGEREVIATAENISPGGAFLRVDLPAAAEDLVATIHLPHGRGLHVHAKVRWRRAEPPGIGVEFASFLEGPWDEISRSV